MSLEQRVAESITRATERAPAPAFDLATIRRGARRRTTIRAASATAAVVIGVAGLAATRLAGGDSSLPPVQHPTSTPTPTPSTGPTPEPTADPTAIPDVRDSQVVVSWDEPPSPPSVQTLVGRETSEDPGGADGEVSVTGPVHAYMQLDGFGWKRSCSGAPGTWWVFTVQPGASFSASGRCDGSGQPTSAPPPESLDGPMVGGPADLPGRVTDVEVRMFLTDSDPAAYLDCVNGGSRKCDEPPHAAASGAQFAVELYARDPLAPATTIFGSEVYPAARVLGTTYTFTTAVAAASGSRVLSYQLPASDHARIVQAMAGQAEPCRHPEGNRTPTCLPAPRLRVDGELQDNGAAGLFTTLAARTTLAPGSAHEITLEIPASDTDVLDLGFVVFEARGG